eukprot:6290996-Karenia_brevis.AAC.1
MHHSRFPGHGCAMTWNIAKRHRVKQQLCSSGGDLVQQALSRYFKYAGHVARMPLSSPTKFAMCFRDASWRAMNRSKSWHNPAKVLCPHGGVQVDEWDWLIADFAASCGWDDWKLKALDRQFWVSREKDF